MTSEKKPADKEAQKRIRTCWELGGIRLNLSGLNLAALPPEIHKLTQLQSLNLALTRLKTLPEWLGQLTQLQTLDLSLNQLTALPESLAQLTCLRSLNLHNNQMAALPESLELLGQIKGLESLWLSFNKLTTLPESLGQLTQLRKLQLSINQLKEVPDSLGQLTQLQTLDLSSNQLTELPESLGQLTQLQMLDLSSNQLTELPESLGQLTQLQTLDFAYNLQINPGLTAVGKEGLDAIKRYLRAKAQAQVVLNEAKLILIGEGEVGKSALLGALRGDKWVEKRDSTHGIEIKPVKVTDPDSGTEITLNGWDFGGQRVYRPTHQLFFSAPAVYLVVWKPREGSQAGAVKEWIKLVKHREPDAKILVVATHGGPGARQPDIDRQEIWDLFGKKTVIDFFHVDSRPPKASKEAGTRTGACKGIKALKEAIGRVAASLPEVGRSVPKRWQAAREALRKIKEAYLPLDRVFAICKGHQVEEEDASLLLRICHRVGDLIHYEHDPLLKDIVVLKPDWLATAISFVLDDAETRTVGHGLVKFDRLGLLWHDAKRPKENRYAAKLHPIFLRLMERFDLSYRIAEHGRTDAESPSLISQLVPDVWPEQALAKVWPETPSQGNEQQVQICRIVETANNQSATAEGLFYQLIVRLHQFSLGRANFCDSVHWQRGLVLEDETGARAFLEHIGYDVRITVRSPYPPRFLSAITYEVQGLVKNFWDGLRCEVTVPCLLERPNGERCKGLFEVGNLFESKREGYPKVPCPICNKWQSIDQLLNNAPEARANPLEELLANSEETMRRLDGIRRQLATHETLVIGRFDQVDAQGRETISKVEAAYSGLMRTLLDEAKEGPRLFTFEPVEPGFWNKPKWISARFKLTLWCEHSRRPRWFYAPKGKKQGEYVLEFPKEWLVKAAPFFKVLSTTLSAVMPIPAAIPKAVLAEADFKGIEAQLALGKSTAESLLKGGDKLGEWFTEGDGLKLDPGRGDVPIRAEGAVLRQLHAWLKEKDPALGGLARVQNKQQEFLWVH